MQTDEQVDNISFFTGPQNGSKQRLVVAMGGDQEVFRDTVETDSDRDRQRFLRRLESVLGCPGNGLNNLSPDIVKAADDADESSGETVPHRGTRDNSQASQLVQLADAIELFHDPEGHPYATVEIDGHFENWSLRRKGFKDWLAREFYRQHEQVPNSQAMNDAINVLSGRALYDGDEHKVHVRSGYGANEEIYVDLGNVDWQAVKITGGRWAIIKQSPIKFIRSKGTLPLPTPTRGHRLGELRQFLNVGDDQWPLMAAWLVAAVRPEGPYPLCVLGGEQGTAKSTVTRILKKLVDPSKADLRPPPRDGRDLAIGASNSRVLAFDNLSWIPDWLSDGLCRLSTGGGFATRQLYSDADEILFDLQRPVILNAIEELGGRGDLLDRSMLIALEQIPDEQRRTEREFWSAFNIAYPGMLGALYDAVSMAIRNFQNVTLDELPRMADFAELAVAAEPAFGVEAGAFLRSYLSNRASVHELALEGSHVAGALRTLVRQRCSLDLTATELLTQLNRVEPKDSVKRQKSWPKNARSLSSHLRRLAPNLRQIGIDISFHPSGKRHVLINRNENWRDEPSPPLCGPQPAPAPAPGEA